MIYRRIVQGTTFRLGLSSPSSSSFSTTSTDCIVLGAGVVGLAIARCLAQQGRRVTLVEQHATFGQETSSRNSQVIHAGIYYVTNTLKAKLCVQGREMMYEYCREGGIPHERIGKLLVATNESQLPQLDALLARGRANGVLDLERVTAGQIADMEPAVRAIGGIYSPSTGLVDAVALMASLERDARRAGTMCLYRHRALAGKIGDSTTTKHTLNVECLDTGTVKRLEAPSLILAAGLTTHRIASKLEHLDPSLIPSVHYAKGNYFALTTRSPFKRLVYPIPEQGGLGIHVSLDLTGQCRFGPDVEWLDGEPETFDYQVDPKRRAAFAKAIQSYYPALREEHLVPAYAGIRPKLYPRSGGDQRASVVGGGITGGDFAIRASNGVVALFGIESPGLTSSLALAEHVAKIMSQKKLGEAA